MRAADTNVLVRLLTGDEKTQFESAKEFAAGGVWVSHLALAEAMWVLWSNYGFEYRDILATVEVLLDTAYIVLQDPDVVAAALNHYRQKATPGFTDCLMLEIARKAGHVPLGTFDKALARLPHVQRI